jgi:sugar/nucleoside kinase (ribokinase family)
LSNQRRSATVAENRVAENRATAYDVLVIGEINPDLVLTGDVTPAFGQAEKVIDDAALTIGSSGVIFACGAARLGLRIVYAGLVGDDIFGRFMLQRMQDRAISTAGIVIDPAQKTGLSVILSHGNDRAILTHLGAMSELRTDQIDRTLLDQIRHIHVTSYFLQRALQPGLPAFLAEARARGITVSLDTNWDPSEQWDDGLAEVLKQVDIFLPNEQEAMAIAGGVGLDEALKVLSNRVPTVVVKQGADGASAVHAGRIYRDPGFRVDVVDSTGAGDSFNAGFLYGYLHGWPVENTLSLACACGALSTRAAGGTGAQPTLVEAEALIRLRSA